MPARPRTNSATDTRAPTGPSTDEARGRDAVSAHPAGAVLAVVVTPRSGVTAFDRREPEAVRVRVAAPPVAGAASAELIRFLAEAVGLPRSRVRVVAGTTGRRKRILFAGLSPAELCGLLTSLVPVSSES